jgi:hypothetical protein
VAAIDERPLEVYAGEFLHGLELPGAPLFEEWADERRREYRTIALAALDRELGLALDRDDAARGIAIARAVSSAASLHSSPASRERVSG